MHEHSGPLVAVAYDSVVRSAVREISIVVSYIAASVVWRVVARCCEQELAAAVFCATLLWDGLVAGTSLAATALLWLGSLGASAAEVAYPHALALLSELYAAAVPVAGFCAQAAGVLLAWLVRAYAWYVSTWMQLTMSIYLACWTPIRLAASTSAALFTWMGAVAWHLVFLISMRVHFIVFVIQSTCLVFLTWHSIPGLATTSSSTSSASSSSSASSATSLQMLTLSLCGPRVSSFFNWVAVSQLLQHGYTLLHSLTSYFYTNMILLLVIFALRMIPFVGFLCLPLEVFLFPYQSAVSFAAAIQVGRAGSGGSSSSFWGSAASERMMSRRARGMSRHHRRTSSTADDDDTSPGVEGRRHNNNNNTNDHGVVTRAGVLRAVATLAKRFTSNPEYQQWARVKAEELLSGGVVPTTASDSGGSASSLVSGVAFCWRMLLSHEYGVVLLRYLFALLIQLTLGDVIDFVFWVVPWALFFGLVFVVFKLYMLFKGQQQQQVATGTAAIPATPAPAAAAAAAASQSLPAAGAD